MMKRIVIYLIILMSSVTVMVAQPDKSKIKEIKVAYFTEKLKLTKSESEKFWKIYDQYDTERHELRKAAKKPEDKKKFSEMSDKEIYEFVDYAFDIKEKELALQRKYFAEFKKILPAQKVVKLIHIEEQFRQYLFRQAQERK